MTPLPRLALPAFAMLAALGAAQARPAGGVSQDSDRVLMRMAAQDSRTLWPAWRHGRPRSSVFPPATRERVAAPPFTGWGYGTTIPGAWPSFQ